MEHIYNKNNRVFSIEDFQHPFGKQSIEKVTSFSAFNKILAFISEKSIEKSYHLMNDSSLLKISREMSPKIFSMMDEAIQMFDVSEAPEVYIERSYDLKVLLDGIESPFLVFTTSVLEQYDDSMLWPLIASEIAGIKTQFAEIKFVDKVLKMFKGTFPFVIDIGLTLALNDWYRCTAYTYDRAFLLASENFELTAKHILFGEVDSTTLDKLHLDQQDNDYYKQSKEFLERSGRAGVYQKITTVFSRSQWAASRYIELYNWYFTGKYDEVVERSMK